MRHDRHFGRQTGEHLAIGLRPQAGFGPVSIRRKRTHSAGTNSTWAERLFDSGPAPRKIAEIV